jgi:hydroxyacylglutathione hydrolase
MESTREGMSSEGRSRPPIIETLPVGALQANCYLVQCPETHQAVIIDPGHEAKRILSRVPASGAQITHVIHTHGHFDHISATEQVLAGLSDDVALAAHPADAYLYGAEAMAMAAAFDYPAPVNRAMPQVTLDEGTELEVGTLRLRVVHTPGHTPGGICLLVEPWCVFSGDTLFKRGIGRTDLEGGDEDALYASIERRLYPLDPALTVYPGHGPSTTIGEECRLNPFVRG